MWWLQKQRLLGVLFATISLHLDFFTFHFTWVRNYCNDLLQCGKWGKEGNGRTWEIMTLLSFCYFILVFWTFPAEGAMALFLWLLTMATTCPTKINIPQMMGNSIEVCVRSFDIRASNKWWGVKLSNGKNWWAPFPHQIAAAGSRGKNTLSLGVI